VIVAVSALMLFASLALVFDLGHARDVRRQAQNAADASALAAGNALYLRAFAANPRITPAVNAAKSYAASNFGTTAAQWASCTDPGALPYRPAGGSQCISFDNGNKPLQIRVKIPIHQVDTPFGSMVGMDHISVAALAMIKLEPGQRSKCALCILGSGTHDLQNGDATAAGGDIAFNGNVSVSNNGLVATDGSITVQGTASGPLDNYTPDPVTGQPPAVDPMADFVLPTPTGTVKTDPCTQGPGIYGSVDLRSKTCTLAAGLYIVAGTGAKWDLSGNSTTQLLGTGVTIFMTCGTPSAPVTCTAGQQGATFDASGNAILGFSAPTTGPFAGLALAMDRNNAATFRLTGNGASGMKGTIYMPKGTLQMNGNGCTTIDSLIVVGDLQMNGNPSCLNSSYVPGDNVEFPPAKLHLTM